MHSERASRKFYDKLGAQGLADIAFDAKTREDMRLVKRCARGARDILDLACGYGRIAIPLAKLGYRVRGIDLSREMIRDARMRARKTRPQIEFKVGSMIDLPYGNAEFDRVFCLWSSFNHMLNRRDQAECLNEMCRVLRPGGIAFVESVNGASAPLRRKMRADGFGPQRRLLEWELQGATITHFIHDADSLSAAIRRSRFDEFTVKLTTVFHHRRLIAILKKS
jgi:ubiquinone/menaquinone biosynthesis C-methylase UbiE